MTFSLLIVGAVIGLAMLVGIPVVIVFALAGREGRSGALATVGVVAAVLLAIGLVVALGAGMLYVRTQQVAVHQRDLEIRAMETARADEIRRLATTIEWSADETNPAEVLDDRGVASDESADPADADSEQASANEASVEYVVYAAGDQVGRSVAERPDWAAETERMDGIEWNHTRVLASQPWATIDEAEAELARRTTQELAAYLRHTTPEASSFTIPLSLVEDTGIVARRCLVTESMQIGEFSEPIHRVYWELEYDPEVSHVLTASWREQVVERRLIWLGGGVGALTVLLGSLGVYSRLNEATGGRYRGRLRVAAGAVCLAVGLAATMLA